MMSLSAGLGARSSFLATAMTDENRLHHIYRKCWKFCVAILREHAVIELAFAGVDCGQTLLSNIEPPIDAWLDLDEFGLLTPSSSGI
jgi:hypothetical protein